MKSDQQKIVGFSLESLGAGDALWGRRAATPAFHHTIEWTVSELKTAGLKDAKVETYAVPGAMWAPRSWRLQILGDPAFGAGTQTVTEGLERADRFHAFFIEQADQAPENLIAAGRGTSFQAKATPCR